MDTSYTPLENPDLSGLDPSTIGVDSTITTQTINSQLSPFSLDSNNTLNINKVASFASDITVGGVINNTDLSNKLSNKSSKISTAPATIVLGQSADIVYFVNENSVSYSNFRLSFLTYFVQLRIIGEIKTNGIIIFCNGFFNNFISCAPKGTLQCLYIQ
jgi:hypothetical protein